MDNPEHVVLELTPRDGNPRNSEGAFVTLKDGRTLFAWTKFVGTEGGDHDLAVIASRVSTDQGRTWSDEDDVLVDNEGGLNVMSVSSLRLQDGRIALFYLRKDSIRQCRPFMRISSDEAASWSEPTPCIQLDGYFVVNNDRVVQLKNGRIIIPAAYALPLWIKGAEGEQTGRQVNRFFHSDDAGKTWFETREWCAMPTSRLGTLQEPGLVELTDGRLFAWARTGTGCQWGYHSFDGGDSWTAPFPTVFTGPCAPLSIKRIPTTGDLLAVWNHHSPMYDLPNPDYGSAQRTPLAAAISSDDGTTWKNHRLIESDHDRAFCYIAIDFTDDDHVLLAYGTGVQGKPGESGEGLRQRLRRVPVSWFYE